MSSTIKQIADLVRPVGAGGTPKMRSYRDKPFRMAACSRLNLCRAGWCLKDGRAAHVRDGVGHFLDARLGGGNVSISLRKSRAISLNVSVFDVVAASAQTMGCNRRRTR